MATLSQPDVMPDSLDGTTIGTDDPPVKRPRHFPRLPRHPYARFFPVTDANPDAAINPPTSGARTAVFPLPLKRDVLSHAAVTR